MGLFNVSGDMLDAAFISVKDFGATGDGITDDTQAIQDAIDYSKENGGAVYFPEGTYLLATPLFNPSTPGIASALMVYEGQTLLGDKGARLKAGSESVTHLLFTYNAGTASGYDGIRNVKIRNLIFDGNAGLTNDITHVNISHAANVLVEDCQFTNVRTWHAIEINAATNTKIVRCLFFGNGTGQYREDIQIDAATGSGNLGTDDGTVCTDIEIVGCKFETNGYPAVGNHSNAAHNNIRVHGNVMTGNGGSRGYISFVALTKDVDIYENTFYETDAGIVMENANQNSTAHDNRFYDNETPWAGGVVAYNNMIDGVFTA